MRVCLSLKVSVSVMDGLSVQGEPVLTRDCWAWLRVQFKASVIKGTVFLTKGVSASKGAFTAVVEDLHLTKHFSVFPF